MTSPTVMPPDGLTILAIDPIDHDFGTVDVGQSARRPFVVKNTGSNATASLVLKLGGADAYRISNDGCTGIVLAAEGTCSVEVEYAPKSFGVSTSSLEVVTGDRTTAKATLRGLARDSVTLTVAKTGQGSVTGTGIACGSDCSETFPRTTDVPPVALTATPAAGWFFSGWTGGGCAGLVNTCTVALTTSQTATAAFTQQVPLDFSLLQGPGATTTIKGAPGTLACGPGACANVITTYDVGAEVKINVTSADAYRFFGDCTNGTCTLKMTQPRTVELRTTGYNYGFVTSADYTGNLGGLAGADAKCASLATAGKLPGTFKAWLSTAAIDAKDRFVAGGGWVRHDGKILATTKADLLTIARMRNPLWLDEQGVERRADPAGERVWTASQSSGVVDPGVATCQDWTDGSAGLSAVVGNSQAGISWTSVNASPCSISERLYCLADDLARPVPLPAIAAASRRAFTSVGAIAADQGVAKMDALCRSEASAASLPNPLTYKALVAPANAATAASRLMNPNGAKWVRVDGVELAPTAADFLAAKFTAPLDASATGITLSVAIFTGYRRDALETRTFDEGGTHTCDGWSTASVDTARGSGSTDAANTIFTASHETGAKAGCDVLEHLYCVED